MISENYICASCNAEIYIETIEDNLEFCPVCGDLSLEIETGNSNEI